MPRIRIMQAPRVVLVREAHGGRRSARARARESAVGRSSLCGAARHSRSRHGCSSVLPYSLAGVQHATCGHAMCSTRHANMRLQLATSACNKQHGACDMRNGSGSMQRTKLNMRHGTANMQQTTCNAQHGHAAHDMVLATCNPQRATHTMQHTTWCRQHATHNMQRTTCNTQHGHAARNMVRATCDMRHATCGIVAVLLAGLLLLPSGLFNFGDRRLCHHRFIPMHGAPMPPP